MSQVKLIDASNVAKAKKSILETSLIRETPMLCNVGSLFDLPPTIELSLKLENMQTNGSFKLRGVINQFQEKLKDKDTTSLKLVTFSAGNYGKAFSFLCSKKGLKGKVLLPITAAKSRIKYIEDQGLETELFESGELLLKGVDDHVKEGWELFHPIDDTNLISGYAPIAEEILKCVEEPDIVLVCCGGGALLAGVSSGLSFLDCKSLVYGVEPKNASTMYQSFEKNKPAVDYSAKSIAGGLAPPLAGVSAYYHCKNYVQDIILVDDHEIISACKRIFEVGLKVEPSGCAGLAALLANKIPNLDITKTDKKVKIVILLSGGNVTVEELNNIFNQSS